MPNSAYIGNWHLSGNRDDPVDAVARRGWDYWAVRNVSHQHDQPRYWINDAIKKIYWDGAAMKATNAPEADKYIKPAFREGWGL